VARGPQHLLWTRPRRFQAQLVTMVYSLLYTRPPYVGSSTLSLSSDEKRISIENASNSSSENVCIRAGIPAALSFDRIVSGGTCPPVTVRDMMNYLKYIEHAAENLQFYLWYRDYSARWENLPKSEKALTPEWTRSQLDAEIYGTTTSRPAKLSPLVTSMEQSLMSRGSPTISMQRINPQISTPQLSAFDEKHHDMNSDWGTSFSSDAKMSAKDNGEQAFDDAGMHWKPFTSQPFRDEVTRVVGTYLAEGSPRELNISARERRAVLHALQHTTHPSAFQQIATSVEYSLRKQAHPNFIRWTICNGNRPRVLFARGLGIFLIAAALIADILLTLSSAARAWRVLPLFAWALGISTLIAAIKGMCVVLHGLHHRHLRPWELFTDDGTSPDDASVNSTTMIDEAKASYETEPWVPKYQKRNFIRKIFDRQVWVQEPCLRQIQDTIFLQSILGGLLLGGLAVGIFCAVPGGHLF